MYHAVIQTYYYHLITLQNWRLISYNNTIRSELGQNSPEGLPVTCLVAFATISEFNQVCSWSSNTFDLWPDAQGHHYTQQSSTSVSSVMTKPSPTDVDGPSFIKSQFTIAY